MRSSSSTDGRSLVLVTGGGGYAGAVLVPRLVASGFRVRVLDLFLFGRDVFGSLEGDPALEVQVGDIRDGDAVDRAVARAEAVVHLAAISNDPSSDLRPELARETNYDAVVELVARAKRAGVRRFVNASSSSVYGVREELEVTEELPLAPITLYAELKAESEKVVLAAAGGELVATVLRPATLCGFSRRQRLDLTVNILTDHAVRRGVITVLGGEQQRPNLHVEDMADAYVAVLKAPAALVQGQVFNVGFQNRSVRELAEIVRSAVGEDVRIERAPTNDLRSYRVSSKKIGDVLGFRPRRTIEDAVRDLSAAFREGRIPDPDHARYHNVRWLKEAQFR